MQTAMVGPGRMGADRVGWRLRGGRECRVFDVCPQVVEQLVGRAGVAEGREGVGGVAL
jgi:6-phosphogluconate dehydrogenase (decarboxylating)